MYLIDTNIFLEVLLDQQKADECAAIIDKLHSGEMIGYVSAFTLHSIEVTLERDKKIEMLKSFLKDINESSGLKRFDTTTLEEIFVLELMKRAGLNFDDALNYYICKTLNLKIISFDKHFDKTDVKCLEPKDILKKRK